MEEIKFRAYSKSLNKMLSFEHLKSATRGMVDAANAEVEKKGIKVNKPSPYGLFLPLEDEDLEFMQYTCRVDRYKTEIFEGDLVYYVNSNHDEEDGAAQVVFENGEFALDCDYLYVPLSETESWELEVIGNIYENPELMEVD